VKVTGKNAGRPEQAVELGELAFACALRELRKRPNAEAFASCLPLPDRASGRQVAAL